MAHMAKIKNETGRCRYQLARELAKHTQAGAYTACDCIGYGVKIYCVDTEKLPITTTGSPHARRTSRRSIPAD